MVLIGTPVHGASVAGVDDLLDAWASWERTDLDFHLVFNGRLHAAAIATVRRALRRRPDLPIRFEVLTNGHLSGWGPLLAAQRRIRQRTLEGGYSHLLWHEVSRMAGPEALPALERPGLGVAGALYKDSWHPGYYCVYSFDERRRLHLHQPYVDIDLIDRPTAVDGMGFGFTLIRRDVLERIPLRSGAYAADTYFFQDLAAAGIRAWACPVFVENMKVERDEVAGVRWQEARAALASRTA